jgi:sugar (pentulose or hexulose) kinase
MAILLGMDVGTTNIKVVLADSDGTILDIASSATEVMMPFDGASEMDMEVLWERLCGLTKQLKSRNPKVWKQIEGAGISAQGDGMWAIDRQGKPVGNAVLWNDTRTKVLTDIDEDAVDKFLMERSSTALFSGAFPLILKWMKLKQPEHFKRIDKVFRCKDWLNFRLTGNVASDYTDFSTCGINIFTHEYVYEMFDLLDISEAKEMMPQLIAPTDIVGKISASAEKLSGIPEGVPVIAGAIDVVVTSVGAGVTEVGESCCIIGTTLCNEVLIDEGSVDISDRRGSALCSVFPGEYLRVMAALSGASTIDWIKDILAPELSFPELDKLLETIPTGSRGIIYHPYIRGERSPFRNPFACGGFYGLTARHTRFDMMKAAFEGMVLSIKDCFNALPKGDGQIFLSGGGAVSDLSCQLISDALGKEVIRPNLEELGARGIVELIKIGLNIETSSNSSAENVDLFAPDLVESGKLELMYAEFLALKNNMTEFWNWRSNNIRE